jgi:hypothetical protein
VQKAHLPTDNPGVCSAMTMHWAERSLRSGDPRFSYSSEMGRDGKGLRQKFEDLVADQKIAHASVQQAALREGLQLVGRQGGDRNQVRQSGQPLIDNALNAALLDGARTAKQMATEEKTKLKAGRKEPDADADAELARLDQEIAEQQHKIDETSQTVRDSWLGELSEKLGPGKTFAVVFTHGHSGHAVGIRTAPPVPDPMPEPPPVPRPTPYIDVMDPNLGEFHFDNANQGQIDACGEFLKKWGDEYLGKRGYDGAYFYEIKP